MTKVSIANYCTVTAYECGDANSRDFDECARATFCGVSTRGDEAWVAKMRAIVEEEIKYMHDENFNVSSEYRWRLADQHVHELLDDKGDIAALLTVTETNAD